MKICLINSLYKPYGRGGVEQVVENIAQGLKDRYGEVFIITSSLPQGGRALRPRVTCEGRLKIYRFWPLNLFSFININKKNAVLRLLWHFFDILNLHSYFVVKQILKSEKPELILTHNLKGLGYLIPRMIKRLKIKHIHTVHDVQLAVPSGLIIKGQEANFEQKIILRAWYEKFCRWLFFSPQVVVSPSRWLMDFYLKKGFFKNSKRVILPNLILSGQKEAMRGARPTAKGFNFLYLGQINRHKGIFFLIETFNKLTKYQIMDTKYHLHIVGSGAELGEVRDLTEGNPQIIVHGFISPEKFPQIFSKISLTIVPSLCYENSPQVIYESLGSGVPVIAAKIGGVPELIKEGYNGFTFEAGDEKELLSKMRYCLENREKVNKMRENCLDSSQEYSVERYLQKLMGLADP